MDERACKDQGVRRSQSDSLFVKDLTDPALPVVAVPDNVKVRGLAPRIVSVLTLDSYRYCRYQYKGSGVKDLI